MALKRVRVPVRFSTGKSIPLGGGSGTTVEQVSQTIVNQSGGLVSSTTNPTAIITWPNVLFVPPSILSPPIPQPTDDPDDALIIPGPIGLTGKSGANAPIIWPDDPDDAISIPGPPGAAGAAGATGAPGLAGASLPIILQPEDSDDPLPPIPGPVGPAGAAGATGPAGAAGPQGGTGVPIIFEVQDPDDYIVIPGPVGATGAQGPQGPAGSGGGNASMVNFQDWEPDEEPHRAFYDPSGMPNIVINTYKPSISTLGSTSSLNITAGLSGQIDFNLGTDTSILQITSNSVNVTGYTNGQPALSITAPNVAGSSVGALIQAGTNNVDFNMKFLKASTATMGALYGDGGLYLGVQTLASHAITDCGPGTVNADRGHYIGGAPLQIGSAVAALLDYDYPEELPWRAVPQNCDVNVWGATQTFAPAAGEAIYVVGNSGEFMGLGGSSTLSSYIGLYAGNPLTGTNVGYIGYGSSVLSGAGNTDFIIRSAALLKLAAAGNHEVLRLTGATAPTIEGYGPTAAALVDMTPDRGSFTITGTGFSGTAPSGTAFWARVGNLVFLNLPALSGTSSATTFTLTGLPAAIQPANVSSYTSSFPAENNTLGVTAIAATSVSSGTLTLTIDSGVAGTGAWTNSGTKGFPAVTIVYQI